jgi:hypothetical protein
VYHGARRARQQSRGAAAAAASQLRMSAGIARAFYLFGTDAQKRK